MNVIYIALGSNINPQENLIETVTILRETFPDIVFSSVYKTAPMEIENQDDFLNAVARFQTDDDPEKVYAKLKEIEQALKKNPPERYGPRTIDLDLLLYDDQKLKTDKLVIPHPKMHERRFVLEPLCELIDPSSHHPGIDESWGDLLEKNKDQRCTKIPLIL